MPTNGNSVSYFIYVHSIAEVYNYNVLPGTSGFFMEIERPVLHIKSVDVFNKTTVETYDLVKREIAQAQPDHPVGDQTPTQLTADEIVKLVSETVRSELSKNRKPYKNNYRRQQQED